MYTSPVAVAARTVDVDAAMILNVTRHGDSLGGSTVVTGVRTCAGPHLPSGADATISTSSLFATTKPSAACATMPSLKETGAGGTKMCAPASGSLAPVAASTTEMSRPPV